MTTEENLEQIDLENIITGLGAVYLKKHTARGESVYMTIEAFRSLPHSLGNLENDLNIVYCDSFDQIFKVNEPSPSINKIKISRQ